MKNYTVIKRNVVYFCYSSSLNVCVAYIFLFWIAIWLFCGKVTTFGFLLVMFPLGSSYFMFVFFPFDVSDGRCGIIVSIPDHCPLLFLSTMGIYIYI